MEFGQEIYNNDSYYRNSMSDILCMFLLKKTVYLNHAEIYPFFIENNGNIILRAAFIIDDKQKDMLMISFFEARKNAQDAVDVMLNHGKTFAQNRGLKRIAIGLDGHLNYSMGFLSSHFDTVPTLGFPYNPAYYLTYFEGMKEYNFTSFMVDIEKFSLDREEKILQRLQEKGYTFRYADFKHLNREIETYTQLNNVCFKKHLWWTDRTFAEDRELLYPFRWFISGENLIIAEKDREPIGFMLWYPDFNQLIKPGKEIGITTLVKKKLGIGCIDRIKIAEMAVNPSYQGTGVILGLFQKLYDCVKDKYKYCEAGWVLEENLKSKGFGMRWESVGCKEYKKYKAYEVLL